MSCLSHTWTSHNTFWLPFSTLQTLLQLITIYIYFKFVHLLMTQTFLVLWGCSRLRTLDVNRTEVHQNSYEVEAVKSLHLVMYEPLSGNSWLPSVFLWFQTVTTYWNSIRLKWSFQGWHCVQCSILLLNTWTRNQENEHFTAEIGCSTSYGDRKQMPHPTLPFWHPPHQHKLCRAGWRLTQTDDRKDLFTFKALATLAISQRRSIESE